MLGEHPNRETTMGRRLMLAAVMCVVAGCGEPRFDATNQATINASVERMSRNLDEAGKKRLLRGVMSAALPAAFRAAREKRVAGVDETTKALHGLTAREIMERGDAYAERIKASARPAAR